MNAQDRIIKQLESLDISRTELVKELTELLQLSERTVYDRLSAKTVFTINEADKIMQHYGFAPSQIYSRGDSKGFSSTTLSLDDFIDQIIESWLEEVRYLGHQEKASLYVCSNVLPYSLIFGFPEIMKFQLYFMYYYLFPDRPQGSVRFEPKSLSYKRLEEVCPVIDSAYNDIPSTEIWGPDTISIFARQISYSYEEKLITDTHKREILDNLNELIDLTKAFVTNGVKEEELSRSLRSNRPSFTLVSNHLLPVEEYTIIKYLDSDQTKFRVYNPVFGSIISESQQGAVENYFYHLQKMGQLLNDKTTKTINSFFKDISDRILKSN